ncbi:MAG TPA: M67 family metallopeptidase [Candidatus Acidoferrum sp.]|jgi:proteasome lid subunit RPN8/RPN11
MDNAAQLKMSSELADSIRQHGAEAYPHECCGALLGRDTEVADRRVYREIHAVHPLINRREDSPQNRFSVTSQDVLEAEKDARDRGLEVVGWYHSHPDHPACPSQYDRDHAWPWYSYIIVSVANKVPEEMTSWRLADDRTDFECEEIGLQQAAF